MQLINTKNKLEQSRKHWKKKSKSKYICHPLSISFLFVWWFDKQISPNTDHICDTEPRRTYWAKNNNRRKHLKHVWTISVDWAKNQQFQCDLSSIFISSNVFDRRISETAGEATVTAVVIAEHTRNTVYIPNEFL